jgi:hypothetical protein
VVLAEVGCLSVRTLQPQGPEVARLGDLRHDDFVLCAHHFSYDGMMWQEIKSNGWSMVREDISVRERVDALTQLISRQAWQQFNVARARAGPWRCNRRGPRVAASLPPIARPSVRRIPSSRRYVSATPDCQTSSAHRSFGVASRGGPALFPRRQRLRLAVPGQQHAGKIPLDVLVFKTIDTLGLLDFFH